MKSAWVVMLIMVQANGFELYTHELQKKGDEYYEHESPTLIELSLLPSAMIKNPFPRSRKRCEVNHHGCEEAEVIEKLKTLERLREVGKRSIEQLAGSKLFLGPPLLRSYYDY